MVIEFSLRGARRDSGERDRERAIAAHWFVIALTLAALVSVAGVASAADDEAAKGDVEGAAEAPVETNVPCPALTRAKYPFLTCSLGANGQVQLDPTGGTIRGQLIPDQSAFIGSVKYWGN
jgi:hypothetical protein